MCNPPANKRSPAPNVLVAIFSERESHAAVFLNEQDITRLDVVNYISHGISRAPGGWG